jgi:large subunit ribosomal protein L7e
VRAERYMAEYVDQENALLHAQEKAKEAGNIFVPPEPRLAFVIRIRGYVVVVSFIASIIVLVMLIVVVIDVHVVLFLVCL